MWVPELMGRHVFDACIDECINESVCPAFVCFIHAFVSLRRQVIPLDQKILTPSLKTLLFGMADTSRRCFASFMQLLSIIWFSRLAFSVNPSSCAAFLGLS